MKEQRGIRPKTEFGKATMKGMRLAAAEARRVAIMHGTPIYIMREGKIVAVKPEELKRAARRKR